MSDLLISYQLIIKTDRGYLYMLRNIDLDKISDGRLYSSGDMVRADCHDCSGCSSCCRGMGSSIVLDPMDIWRFSCYMKQDFCILLENKYIELNVVDGLVLPNIKMDEKNDGCLYLDENGRCTIHMFRPGLCRLFPLGRYYEEKGFKYFLQVNECRKKDRGKIKIKKLLDIPNLKAYEKYIDVWHCLLNRCRNAVNELGDKEKNILTLYILRIFYENNYVQTDEDGFYCEFYKRMETVLEKLGFTL